MRHWASDNVAEVLARCRKAVQVLRDLLRIRMIEKRYDILGKKMEALT